MFIQTHNQSCNFPAGINKVFLPYLDFRASNPVHTHARTHARTHSRTHARTHAQELEFSHEQVHAYMLHVRFHKTNVKTCFHTDTQNHNHIKTSKHHETSSCCTNMNYVFGRNKTPISDPMRSYKAHVLFKQLF